MTHEEERGNGHVAVAEIAEIRPTHTAAGSVYLTQLSVSSLTVDHRYQRLVNPHKVKQMVANYQPGAIGALDVSVRVNGTYAVIDGQHRLEVLREVAPHDLVNCVVHTNLSPSDEAELFHISNARRDKPSATDRFRARLFYQDPRAVEIARIVEAAGLVIDLTTNANDSASPRSVNAVGALEKVYQYGGDSILSRTLTLLHGIWPEDRAALSGDMLHGLGMVLNTYGDAINTTRLVGLLSVIPIRKLMMEAAGHRALLGGAPSTNLARAIVKHYNHGLRNRLPESELGHPTSNPITPEPRES